jgi:predicted transcriptional regulator of viral defense system
MTYQQQLRRIAAYRHGIITTAGADEIDIPAVTLRKLALRGTLRKIGHGVYRFDDYPQTRGSTEAEAVALVGEDAYLEGESVLGLLDLGHANPVRVEIATTRQVRRKLPAWIKTTRRTRLNEDETTTYFGVPSVKLKTALQQVKARIPRSRWEEALNQADRRELLGPNEVKELTQKLDSVA